MRKISIIISSLLLMLITFTKVNSDEKFSSWIIEFKKKAINEGISEKTVDAVMNNAIFLPKVIEYDRYQPEFYEDTKTYVSKRTSKDKVKKGKRIYKKNKNLINIVDKEFKVEKELLLALMGIETNYGTYLGKMDIISSLATLSYDKRRSEFFSNELITILKLIDQNKVDKDILFGSWAGAFGNFQFMPTTISNYAIDYNNNSIIELKEAEDSFASAANYLNKIGWRKNEPCFFNIELNENIPRKLLNTSAKKIKHKRKFKYYKKYIKEFENLNIGDNVKVAVITPDSDIVKNNNKLKPAYLVFSNYDRVLKWNRSLRFAIAVCTLKNKFENEL
jgi:membrane-bound lytic murein transglycosylase B